VSIVQQHAVITTRYNTGAVLQRTTESLSENTLRVKDVHTLSRMLSTVVVSVAEAQMAKHGV
jgi:hypothetical protein